MVAFVFIIVAAILNACMDRVETKISFNDSIFWRKDPHFYCKPISAGKVKFIPMTRYRPDFWHLCKSGVICCLLAVPFFYTIIVYPFLDYILMGLVYNVVFEQFYSKILKDKKN